MPGSATPFSHLHVHTEYSLLDGCARIGELTQECARLAMPALAITDHGAMHGVIEFYQACRREGLRPVIGMEAYIRPRGPEPSPHHLVLLAQDNRGYRNLMALATLGHLEGGGHKPTITKEQLDGHSVGLIGLSACLQGEVARYVLAEQPEEARRSIGEYVAIFGRDRFYLELERHDLPEEERVCAFLQRAASDLRLGLVAANDVHYVHQSQARSHELLLCVQTLSTYHDGQRLRLDTDQFHLRSPDEMSRRFPDCPHALRTAAEVADRCDVEIPLGRLCLPHFEVPSGHTADSYLRTQAEDGCRRRYRALTAPVRARLEHELAIIAAKGLSAYLLIVQDIVRFALRQGIPVGPGRGSVGGSLVAYALGITDVEPLANGLLFERFLSPDRHDMPDIDVDFCQRRRDEVLRYVVQRYGEGHVAHIAAFTRLAPRGAIRDIGRALNMSYAETDRIASRMPTGGPRGSLQQALDQLPELRDLPLDRDPVKTLIGAALDLEGIARHVAMHPAGVVVSQQPLTEMVPLRRAPKGEVITQYDMYSLEDLGLLKVDLLGLRALTIIQDTLRIARRTALLTGGPLPPADMRAVPLDDPAAYALLREARTDGLFQVESPGMQSLLRRAQPRCADDLTAIVALYRPGPMRAGMLEAYIRRRREQEPQTAPHPALAEPLADTQGLLVFQEQVMRIAHHIAGFTMGEADGLRKALAGGDEAKVTTWRERFTSSAQARGHTPEDAQRIWDLLAGFGGYCFSKAHSVACATTIARSAYVKAHYPAEFRAALLTSEMGYYGLAHYAEEAKRSGLRLAPPDVNRSEYEFTVEAGSASTGPWMLPTDGDPVAPTLAISGDAPRTIRTGLAVVQGVGPTAISAIIRERRRAGAFGSLADLCGRVDLSVVTRPALENLVRCGALDWTGCNRPQLLAGLPAAMAGAKGGRQSSPAQLALLAEDALPPDELVPEAIPLPAFSPQEAMADERRLLGFYVTRHPLSGYQAVLRRHGAMACAAARASHGGSRVTVAGVVASVRRQRTRRGDQMLFVVLEDTTASLEVVILPELYRGFREVLTEDAVVLVTGRLETAEEQPRLLAQTVAWLTPTAQGGSPANCQVRAEAVPVPA